MAGQRRLGDALAGAAAVSQFFEYASASSAVGTRNVRTSPTTPTPGCGFSRSSNAGGFDCAPATSALSAFATATARSAVEGESPAPPNSSTGPISVETKA